MKIQRRYSKPNTDVFSTVSWVERTTRITQPDGSIVFEMKDARVPANWSQLATDIMVSKYFRKAGVPQLDAEGNLQRRTTPSDNSVITGPEKSAKQVIHRMCGCWKHWGEAHGYFDSTEDSAAFYDELAYMLLHQMAAPNSPQWFNTGLNWAYGLTGPAQGHFVADPRTGEVELAHDAYSHPQPHACFIQSVSDDLVGAGGIMDLWVREARLFKYGSGTGTNFSKLRGEGEPLSGGGTSSGLMSWLRIGDRAAGAIKSGGTTRRAAKMVCLDLDHPDIEKFINWKVREEIKVAAMVEGLKSLPNSEQKLASELGLQLNYDFNGEAYYTISGQNSNNSVRIPDEFFDLLDRAGAWTLFNRTDGQPSKSIAASDLWKQVCYAAWRCADPGVQFDGTINAWHTCPDSGRINASNPCSEYLFLDNTACNLASLNLLAFYDAPTRTFDVEGYEHAIRLWTIVLEISVLMASFPSAEIARLSYEFRTLGLGFANIGAMLMQAGIPYDSDEARALCASLSAVLTGRSYAVSAEMADRLGPFKGFSRNRESMLRVIRNHRRAAHSVPRTTTTTGTTAAGTADAYENLRIKPVPIDPAAVASAASRFASALALHESAARAWDDALALGERHGYRNAQVTVIAPTGTIGLFMDCDTTGVEPDFALVKFKKLAGGGYFKIANNSLGPALTSLGYAPAHVADIIRYVMGALSLDIPVPGAKGTLADFLKAKGFTDDDLAAAQSQLPRVFELPSAFNAWSLRPELLAELHIDAAAAKSDPSFNLLRALGLSTSQVDSLNEAVCGTQTVEGAPHLRAEHLPVFDCANPCGRKGKRYIQPQGHIRMMAASQPFISGAISKTINLPNDASIDDIAACYRLSWELGLKANALYRDGCKLSQPLSTRSDRDLSADDDDDDDLDLAKKEVAQDVGEVAATVAAIADHNLHNATTPMITTTTATNPRFHIPAASPVAAAAPAIPASAPQPAPPPPSRAPVEKIVERIVERPLRRRLPDTRRSITHKFNVAGHEGYLTVGLYEDGMPGELFITMSKEGSTIGGLMDSLGTAISVALQYGVPLESLVGKFSHQRFEPAGMTANRDIPFAKSLVDYIFRWIGMQFIPGYRLQNAPVRAAADSAIDVAPSPAPANNPVPVAPNGSSNPNGANGSNGSNGEHSHAHYSTASTAMRSTASAAATAIDEALAAVGLDDPATVRDALVKHGPIARLQTEIQVVAAIADRDNAEITAVFARQGSVLDRALAEMMGDAPVCDSCGSITVRNGTCYKCLNCGNSMGCS